MLILFIADLLSKQQIRRLQKTGALPRLYVGGRIRIGYVKNTGLMLGLGKKYPRVVRLLPAVLVLVLFVIATTLTLPSRITRIGLALILGGGAANAYDRLRCGFVTDYVNFPRIKRLRNLYFNLADFGIFIGTFLFCVSF